MKAISGSIVLSVLCMLQAHAQSDEIIARGKVVDAATGKAVMAKIRYSSLPTGSIYGRFNDSTFAFSIFGSARYEITAESAGYRPKTVIVDPAEVAKGGDIWQKNIDLMPKQRVVRLESLIFDQGKSSIDAGSYQELDDVVKMMNHNDRMVIQLEGHTDNSGNAKANLKLSEARVEAVRDYLVNAGIAKRRIKTKAFGGSQPLKNEMTPEARAMNRRVEMRILNE